MLSKEFYTAQALKKISCDERAKLFGDMIKGKNENGGTYGCGNNEMRFRRSQ